MPLVSQLREWTLDRTPPAVRRLTAGAAALSAVAIDGVRTTVERYRQSPLERLSDEEVQACLPVDCAETDAGLKATGKLADVILALAAEDRWPEIGARIERADFNGEIAPDGTRLAALVVEVVWQSLLDEMAVTDTSDGPAVLPDATAASILSAADDAIDAPGLAALAAAVGLRLGWMRHSGDWSAMIAPDAFGASDPAFVAAAKRLDRFQDTPSPLIAGIAYELIAANGGGASQLEEAFTRRMALDPDDSAALARHGWYLMPGVFGDRHMLDAFARARLAATQVARGATDYSAAYATALRMDRHIVTTVDMDLFCQGIRDTLDCARDEQIATNHMLDLLMRLGTRCTSEKMPRKEAARRAEMDALFDDIARTKLTTILPHRWSADEPTVNRALAHAFEARILGGEPDFQDLPEAHAAE